MRKGFTLIELLVVIAISVILSTIAIVYGNQGRNQVALSVEAAKISQLTLQAKQLAIAKYNASTVALTCGYGMYFNVPSSTYSLFVYSPSSTRPSPGFCPPFTSVETSIFNPDSDIAPYSQQSWQVPVSQGLTLQSQLQGNGNAGSPSAVAVLFLPPNPQTLITYAGGSGAFYTTTTAYVNIATVDGNASKTITITPAGQVSF